MAAEPGRVLRKRKLKVDRGAHRKLGVDQKVEVIKMLCFFFVLFFFISVLVLNRSKHLNFVLFQFRYVFFFVGNERLISKKNGLINIFV